MILVRNVFKLKFGKSREAVELFREGVKNMQRLGLGRVPIRLLTDVVATFYTLVMEQTFASLAEYEGLAKNLMGNAEWQAWYQKVVPLVESGHREIYNILE
jgi:hypothetical protein